MQVGGVRDIAVFQNIRALVCRPKPQAESLAGQIVSRHGQAWVLPMLDIEPLAEDQSMRNTLLDLDRYDRIIVTSKAAAQYGGELIEQYWPQLPEHTRWYAMGKATAGALSACSANATIATNGNNSEALLSLPEFESVNNEHILILKGLGGRTMLAQTLQERGANVGFLEVYQRLRPQYPPETLVKLLESRRINVILCGSAETVTNLGYYLSESRRAEFPLVVPGERVVQHALDLGFRDVYCAAGADNQAMVSTLATAIF